LKSNFLLRDSSWRRIQELWKGSNLRPEYNSEPDTDYGPGEGTEEEQSSEVPSTSRKRGPTRRSPTGGYFRTGIRILRRSNPIQALYSEKEIVPNRKSGSEREQSQEEFEIPYGN